MPHRDTLRSRLHKTRLANEAARPIDAITRDAWRRQLIAFFLFAMHFDQHATGEPAELGRRSPAIDLFRRRPNL